MKKFIKTSAAFICMFLPLVYFTQGSCPEASDWYLYKNDQEGYRLMLPSELHVAFRKARAREIAVEDRLPFDYVNFRPRQASGVWEPFELGLGVHWNRDAQGTREFADKKDEGLIMNGVRLETVRQSEITVAKIKGVRDDFRMQQPEGWRSYSRVIIPFQDKFFVFLCTVGRQKPLAENEQVFQRILDSFEIENQKAP